MASKYCTRFSGLSVKYPSEYQAWYAAKRRCTDKNHRMWDHYGRRGISMCARWFYDFAIFLKDVGPKPSKKCVLDRINVDGNYEPGNVRWATTTESAINRRYTVWITYHGETLSLIEWSRKLGVNVNIIRHRMDVKGWSAEEAFETPVQKPATYATTEGPFKNVPRTLGEWSKLLGVSTGSLRRRIKRGDPLNQALVPKGRKRYANKNPKKYTCEEMSLTAEEWASTCGLAWGTVRTRIKAGWPLHKVLTRKLFRSRSR